MAVSGMGMKIADILLYQKPGRIGGLIRLKIIKKGILRILQN